MNKVIQADVLDGLLSIPSGTVDCAITSPPYWGQRDYEFDGQIGLEKDYTEYINKSVFIYRQLRNNLKNEGIFFLNIGDKYLHKYGNAPLGMIPYKLAHQMERDGWLLEDILIWYKPNHMPSSIKNRFSNTYEPIFVFSKQNDNYYRSYVNKVNHSTILSIKLQQTPYKHMAVYPEKLIEKLLSFGTPKDGIILDPFAGAGTTGKACLNLNENSLFQSNFSFIMIDANPTYIDIIKSRCRIAHTRTIERKSEYPIFSKDLTNVEKQEFELQKENNKFSINSNSYFFDYEKEVVAFLNILKSEKFKRKFQEDGIIYVGIKNYTIDQINLISELDHFGWIIRNMIVQKIGNGWFPIFMIVKDTKRINYHFNLDSIRISHRSNNGISWWSNSFVGYKVIDNFTLKGSTIRGKVINVLSYYGDGMPKVVGVQWEDNNLEKLPVVHNDNFEQSVSFYCPKCNVLLSQYYGFNPTLKCQNCDYSLWKTKNSIPKLKIGHDYQEKDLLSYKGEQLRVLEKKRAYEGKFKNAKRINLGASPGARSSVQEPYFSCLRIYHVYQPMVADYLNIYRNDLGLTKSVLTNMFDEEYKHTVGHWLRKDMGGSIPNINDWMKLKKILGLDDNYTHFICDRGLKLQIVKASQKGKNPGDFHNSSVEELKKMLASSYKF